MVSNIHFQSIKNQKQLINTKTIFMKTFYLIIFSILLISNTVTAQDGVLDTDFGTNGVTIVDNGTDNAEILALTKSDTKLIASGFTSSGGTEVFTVVRFNLDGTLDTGFGTNGYVIIPLGSGNGRASSILQQADGKYIAGGWARFSNKDQYVVVRILENGTLDNSFGVDGIATGSFSGSTYAEDEIADMKFLSDGKIVVAGRSYNGANEDAFVGCFNTDGSLFTNFGTNGYLIIDFGQSPPYEYATSVAVDGQDNIILGGRVSLDFFDEDAFFLTKLSNLGVTDNSFGDNGKVFYTIAPNVVAGLNVIAIDNENRIVTGGGAFDTDELDNNFFLTRYMPTGVIDASFGNNGEVIIPRIDNESIFDLEILPSGDIIAAGSTGGFPSEFAIVRLNANGVHDLTFGNNGWATTQPESNFNSIRSIDVDAGCIYAGGVAKDSDTWKMALAKYINEGTTSTSQLIAEETDVQIYPNPVSSDFSVEFRLNEDTDISIQLLDVNGRLVSELQSTRRLQQGIQKINLSMPNSLVKGGYLLTLNFEDGVVTKNLFYQ